MDTYAEIMRALGRIEGELIEIRKLSERVARLEKWQWWLKGGWDLSRRRLRLRLPHRLLEIGERCCPIKANPKRRAALTPLCAH